MIQQQLYRRSEGPRQDGEMSREETHKAQEMEIQTPAYEKKPPHSQSVLRLGSSLAGKDPGVLVDTKLSMRQQRGQDASSGLPARLRMVTLYQWSPILSMEFGASRLKKKMDLLE